GRAACRRRSHGTRAPVPTPVPQSLCARAHAPPPDPRYRRPQSGSAALDRSTSALHDCRDVPREYSEPVSQPLQLRRIRVIPGLDPGSKRPFSKKTDRRGHERAEARATLLIGARIAPWRGWCIPAAGGRPIGRPGKWIRSARSSYAAYRGPALVGRGIAAIRTAPPIGRAPCSGIGDGSGQGDPGRRERDKNDRSHDGPSGWGLISLVVAPITPRHVGGAPASGARPVGCPGEWIRRARSRQAANRGPALLERGIAAV